MPLDENYGSHPVELLKTDVFDRWLARLRDARAAARVQARLDRLAMGNPGDAKSVGEGVVEMRIDYGPGYRVYYVRRGVLVILLLCGGDKSTQVKDITRAKQMAQALKE
ncbi:MAG: phage-related protein [Betaproteobacteria bacterium]|nr:phage-related protein [Betaproteobacteria bacterium]